MPPSQPRPIVHVGYHKTGTTWFQDELYPHATSHRLIEPRRVRDNLLNPHAFTFDPDAAWRGLGLKDSEAAILCDEHLSGNFRTGGLMGAMSKEVAGRIHQVLPRARIVIFIRHQVDMIAASYAQYLKTGGNLGPRRYLFPGRYRKGPRRAPFKRPLFAFGYFMYLALIRHYRQLFGTRHVHVFTYEGLRRDPRAFVADYLCDVGLGADTGQVDYTATNAAYRNRTLALARLLNHFTWKRDVDRRHLLPLLPSKALNPLLRGFNRTDMAGRRLTPIELLGEDTVAFMDTYFADSNRLLAKETGLPLADYRYPGMARGTVASKQPCVARN